MSKKPKSNKLVKAGVGPGRSNVPGSTPRDRIKDYRGSYTSCTPEFIQQICDLKRRGMPNKLLQDVLGLGSDTINTWLKKGELGEPYATFKREWMLACVDDFLSLTDDPDVKKAMDIARGRRDYIGDDRNNAAVQVNVQANSIDAPTQKIGQELLRRAAESRSLEIEEDAGEKEE